MKIVRILLILLGTFVFLATIVWLVSSDKRDIEKDKLFSKGLESYAQGKYQEAAENYQELVKQHESTPNVCYNLGNAYARLNQTGLAVLYYQRALIQGSLLTPAFKNLEKIQAANGLQDPTSKWQRFFLWMNIDLWLGFFAFLLSFAALNFLTGSFEKLKKYHYKNGTLISLILVLLMLPGIYATWPWVGRVAVTQPAAVLRISPFESAETTASLKEGEILQLTGLGYSPKTHNDFWQVRTQDGHRGWVQTKYIERVLLKR